MLTPPPDLSYASPRRRLLAALGDPNDLTTRGGVAFHFLQAGKQAGFIDDGLPMSVRGPSLWARRVAWNVVRVLGGDHYGGYQYSAAFLETLWAPYRAQMRGTLVINSFQLYAPSVVADPSIEKWFFIDQTLLQLFDFYGQRTSVGRRIAQDAVEREREGYHAAAGVIANSQWAARSVVENYGVPPECVHVVVPGANLGLALYAAWEREAEAHRVAYGSTPDIEIQKAAPIRQPGHPPLAGSDEPVRLVFVGKDWQRKGLDRLLEGFALARQQCTVGLRVIGCPRRALPRRLRRIPDVEWCGFIDKERQPGRFLSLVAECDVGCLLSRAEAGGIGLREYHALGLPTLVTTAGGSPEFSVPRASVPVPVESTAAEIASLIVDLVREPWRLQALQRTAWEERRSALWSESVRQIQQLMRFCSEGATSTAPGATSQRPTGTRRYLAVVGDANDLITWGGIPYYLLQTAKSAGVLDEGLPLAVRGPQWWSRRLTWNAGRVLAGDHYGGYQYSVPFLETLWAPHRERLHDTLVMNCFQLYPPSVIADRSIEKWFFIDQTLLQLFDFYGQRASVGRHIAQEAVGRERDGYHAAAGVITHSHWAARSVVEDYEVAPEHVHVVVPGANFDPTLYAAWERQEAEHRTLPLTMQENTEANAVLRLVFVGKDWLRKGLDRLLRGLLLARRQGGTVSLRVIGCQRKALPRALQVIPGVEWCGFVDKRRDAAHFLRLVATCDVGCLLSRAEAGGIALREFHALGLAVLGTTAGGSPEHLCLEVSWLLDPHATDETVAEAILEISRDPERLAAAKAASWRQRRSFLYTTTVHQIQHAFARHHVRTVQRSGDD